MGGGQMAAWVPPVKSAWYPCTERSQNGVRVTTIHMEQLGEDILSRHGPAAG